MLSSSEDFQPNLRVHYESFTQRLEAFTALLNEYAALNRLPDEEAGLKEADIMRRMEEFRTPGLENAA